MPLPFFPALLSLQVKPKWQSTKSLEAIHKLMACEGHRLTTTAANKASVFTEFMGETVEQRRQQEKGGGQEWGEK